MTAALLAGAAGMVASGASGQRSTADVASGSASEAAADLAVPAASRAAGSPPGFVAPGQPGANGTPAPDRPSVRQGASPRDDGRARSPDAPQRADPTGVRIGSIGVDAEVVELGLTPDGGLDVPADFDQTGWYSAGPEPGEPGAAVIVGHVDDWQGPAVFFRLGELTPGDGIEVHHADGTTTSFVVEAVETHDKDEFPSERVYVETDEALLRLITCGGAFDASARSYESNVVVFARLEGEVASSGAAVGGARRPTGALRWAPVT